MSAPPRPSPAPPARPLEPPASGGRTTPRRAPTFLGRLAAAVREQNWFAVGLEVLIVVLGVVIGFQVNAWGAAQADERLARDYTARLGVDLRKDRDARQNLVAYYDAVHDSAERTVVLLADPDGEARDLVVHAYRATEYAYSPQTRSTWDEVVSSGKAGLLPRAAVESGLADYFAYDVALDALRVLQGSPYRRRVRSVIPHPVQDAIRERCGDVRDETQSIVGFQSDCDLDVDGALVRATADALRADPAVLGGLRYQFSDLASARANIRGDVVFLDRAIAALEGEGGR